jgi:DGQHR domain-containing protein
MKQEHSIPRNFHGLKVKQWLPLWDEFSYDEEERKARPKPYFYMFSLPATILRPLSGVYRRSTETGQLRSQDLGIQRRHDPKRSGEIQRYVRYGYPWSELNSSKRDSGRFDDLRKPGWLPTAIIVNILGIDDKRGDKRISSQDLIRVHDRGDDIASFELPESFDGRYWLPDSVHPIEVIDGQHRLWAFDKLSHDENFELPVVAFHELDRSWQAYLFWTINIKPKRINPSLAFDLYPLLRTEEWLEKFEGPVIYRQTRAQEIVEALWAYPESPWFQRINMLGEPGMGQMVTQAAWIKSLTSTYIKSWEGKGVSIGGLFGSRVGSDDEVLPWSRPQQSAFLIVVWKLLKKAVKDSQGSWAESLRQAAVESREKGFQQSLFPDFDEIDPAFEGSYDTHLNTNIGTRGVLYITNDLCYVDAENLQLKNWIYSDEESGDSDQETISNVIDSLMNQPVVVFLDELSKILAEYDWRTSSFEGLSSDEKQKKAAIRGGAGYKELRVQLLNHLIESSSGEISDLASAVAKRLGYI